MKPKEVPVPALIETLAADEPSAEPAEEIRAEPVSDANGGKLAVAVECLRFVERWSRRDNWDLRRRVIRALQDIGEWNA